MMLYWGGWKGRTGWVCGVGDDEETLKTEDTRDQDAGDVSWG